MKEFINIAVKGAIIGVANIIPGVSGGTMAFVLGIYGQITESISFFLIRPEKRKEYFFFLLNLFIGIVIGFLVFAKFITFLLGTDLPIGAPLPFTYVPTFGFFLGLILGSIPVLFSLQQDTKFSIQRFSFFILGLLMLFAITQLRGNNSVLNENNKIIKDFGIFIIESFSINQLLWLCFVGFLAAFSMVIPGVSGSALLIALGEYSNILSYISNRSLVPLGAVALGVGAGLLGASFAITKLLKHFPAQTFYFILGLVIASCGQILSVMITAQTPLIPWFFTLITLALGFFVGYNSKKLS